MHFYVWGHPTHRATDHNASQPGSGERRELSSGAVGVGGGGTLAPMTLPLGLTAGSITELGGIVAAVAGTIASVLYTRHIFQLTQQPAWRVYVGEVHYREMRDDGMLTDSAGQATEWVLKNVGKLGATEVTATLQLDRRLRHAISPAGTHPVEFATIGPEQAMVITGGLLDTWLEWRDYADARARLRHIWPIKDRVRVDWVDTLGRSRHRAVRIIMLPAKIRGVPEGDTAPTSLRGAPRPD